MGKPGLKNLMLLSLWKHEFCQVGACVALDIWLGKVYN